MEPAYLLVIGAIWFFFGNLDILTFSHSGIVILFLTEKSLHGCYLLLLSFSLPEEVEGNLKKSDC
jgi:hypothetical protein